jgi:leucyl/phenylalanyl-tRNA--protein transferase
MLRSRTRHAAEVVCRRNMDLARQVRPVEPPPSRWAFGDVSTADPGEELLGVGADLEPGTILAAYRAGLFPMPFSRRGPVGWWSPNPRGVLPLDRLKVSRSLRASCRRYTIRVDSAYDEVVRGCADPKRDGGWIRKDVVKAYRALHDLGWTHSVEAWSAGADGTEYLAGGLYGVAIGGLFAGESMFYRERDASKVALVALVDRLRASGGPRLLDVQWATPHLASLGAVGVDRPAYLRLLRDALPLPTPDLDPPAE